MNKALAKTFHLPSPEHFPAYARAVAEIPALSAEDERELAVRWRDENDQDAARALVLAHLYLVVKAVRDHQGYGLAAGDLAQEGTVGLMKAVKKYDPDRGVRLGTYAWYWIEAEIREFILKNWRLVSWGTSTLAKKLFFGYRKTVTKLQEQGVDRAIPTASEIATAMDISADDAELARSYFLGGDVGLFDEHGGDDDSDHLPNQHLAMVSSDATPEDQAIVDQKTAAILQLSSWVDELPDRQQELLRARFFSDPPQTLTAVAKKWGVSVERVRQIEQSALQMLRDRALKKNTVKKNKN